MVLVLFKEAHEQGKKNVHTRVFESMEQAAVKTFFTKGAYKLHYYKINKLTESQDCTRGLVPYLIEMSSFKEPGAQFRKRQAKMPLLVKRSFEKILVGNDASKRN